MLTTYIETQRTLLHLALSPIQSHILFGVDYQASGHEVVTKEPYQDAPIHLDFFPQARDEVPDLELYCGEALGTKKLVDLVEPFIRNLPATKPKPIVELPQAPVSLPAPLNQIPEAVPAVAVPNKPVSGAKVQL